MIKYFSKHVLSFFVSLMIVFFSFGFSQQTQAEDLAIDVVGQTYSMLLLSPDGDEVFRAGDTVDVNWESGGTGPQPFVSLSYSVDGGDVFETFAPFQENDGHYEWTLPDVTSDQVRVRVIGTELALALATDTSDRNFTIIGTEPLVEFGEGPMENPTNAVGVDSLNPGDVIRGVSLGTLYWVTDDMRRRPFMNEQIFLTWVDSFDDVVVVTDEALSELELGGPMLPKSGTVLMKLQTEDRVYSIEDHPTDSDRAVRRWIPSEEIALQLIGHDWADFVIDLPDTLFGQFTDGTDVTEADTFDRDLMIKRRGL